MKNMIRFSMFVPKRFLLALQTLADKRGSSVAQLIRDAIHEFLKAAGVLAVLMFVGCAQEPEEYITYSDRIQDWQTREQSCSEIETECPDANIDYFYAIKQIIYSVAYSFEYKSEEGDYWKTSTETINDMSGDCEDAAALAYRIISDSCLGLDVRIRLIEMGKSIHAIAIVYLEDGEVIEISNMNISKGERPEKVIAEFTAFESF